MGQKESKHKDRSKEPRNSTTVTPSLYPNLGNEFPTYGQPTTIDFRVPSSEVCFGNTIPFHNVQSHYYNPVPSAPPALPEILGPEISAIAQRPIRQEDGMQTREPETWQNQDCRRTNPFQDKKPCPNAGDGCKLHFAPDQMKQHVKECLFMDVTCPLNGVFGKCAWRDKIKHIETHFSDMHPSHIGAVSQQKTLDSQRIIHLVDLRPHKFLVQMKVEDDKHILFAVQLFSTQVCASRWTYEFEFLGPMMAKKEPLEGTCIPAGTSIENKFNKLQCRVLKMTACVMNAFKNGTLEYKYRIMRRDRMPKKIEGTIEATSKTMTAPTECKGNDVAVVPKRLKQSQKKRPRKPTKTPLECMLTKH